MKIAVAATRLVEKELARGIDLSIVALINGLIFEAHALRASDIHIDPTHSGVRIRLRIDGVLHELHQFPKSIHNEIVSRIKVLSGLRTDEHTASQDGRFRYRFPDLVEFLDMRVSIVPTYHGENAVLRLLVKQSGQQTLANLGFSESDQTKLLAALKRPSGMLLATGPTGSGKTTTLYTLLSQLNVPEVSIVTIEDPIEYSIDGIEQIQVNSRSGLTFANGLRSILRQDPNIIMVGEIRDSETASIAINTALTGHLLLSTLHTSDAATTLPRLLDMGIDAYLVSSTVTLAVGQRLVRKICRACKVKNIDDAFYTGAGCDVCQGSGYQGRVSINEVLVADEKIQAAILRRAPAVELKALAITAGMTPMFEDGMKKVRSGDTTIEELLRVIHE